MGCQSDIAEKIVDLGGDYLLATKDNQKTAHAEIQLYFDGTSVDKVDAITQVDKGHGRIETRRHVVSQRVDWMSGRKRYPDKLRFNGLATIATVMTRIETTGDVKIERRCYVSSRALTARDFPEASRAHWGIESGLHWVLDVQFKEDQCRFRRGHGATNMATIRHLALNLIRAMPGKHSLEAKRKLVKNGTPNTSWPHCNPVNLDSLP